MKTIFSNGFVAAISILLISGCGAESPMPKDVWRAYLEDGDKPALVLQLSFSNGVLNLDGFLTDPNNPCDLVSMFSKIDIKEFAKEKDKLSFVVSPGHSVKDAHFGIQLKGPISGETFPASILDESGKVTQEIVFERVK